MNLLHHHRHLLLSSHPHSPPPTHNCHPSPLQDLDTLPPLAAIDQPIDIHSSMVLSWLLNSTPSPSSSSTSQMDDPPAPNPPRHSSRATRPPTNLGDYCCSHVQASSLSPLTSLVRSGTFSSLSHLTSYGHFSPSHKALLVSQQVFGMERSHGSRNQSTCSEQYMDHEYSTILQETHWMQIGLQGQVSL
ncbi:hypothetical protein NE237_031507 [Protea cynaroides]|uniref:Uncharacterized protein n=1 Tax=Protea cynaroides TaxID=273540 RepID=A0A9Q0R2M8_9MAGN|nr:hypothetical protein NE237_031507 [Protea cynaroides]